MKIMYWRVRLDYSRLVPLKYEVVGYVKVSSSIVIAIVIVIVIVMK
jgi:hypothetical protein